MWRRGINWPPDQLAAWVQVRRAAEERAPILTAREAQDNRLTLSQNTLHDVPMHIGQAEVAALKAVGQTRVIQAAQVQDRGLQIVDVDRIASDAPCDFVGLADDLSAANSPARHPYAKSVWMMIASRHLRVLAVAILTRMSREKSTGTGSSAQMEPAVAEISSRQPVGEK